MDRAWGTNHPTPELRRLSGLRREISRVVAFSDPQAIPAKPQETCGSRRYREGGNARLENRLEQRWEPESNLLCATGDRWMEADAGTAC